MQQLNASIGPEDESSHTEPSRRMQIRVIVQYQALENKQKMGKYELNIAAFVEACNEHHRGASSSAVQDILRNFMFADPVGSVFTFISL